LDGLPIIDVSPERWATDPAAVALEVDVACRDTGFFTIVEHGVPTELPGRVESLAREFFARPENEKAAIAMSRGGRAWRGWFPVGGELTSGVPDMKEGIYFGLELAPDDPRVRAGIPLHGPNLFPARPAALRDAVLEYIDAVTKVGHVLLAAISRALGLDDGWFDRHLTADPIVLFRIFHYPPLPDAASQWSVGEHTDYGLITILGQDRSGGLEVCGRRGWVAVPPIPHAFVVNLGDMLERMTGGRYRSTPHRVRNTTGLDRISFPLFLDPAWDAEVLPIPNADSLPPGDATDRWDGTSVHEWTGTYGEYLLGKVAKVFPELRSEVLPTDDR
jgi:Isopenicillin N synthase and related dioxygenases